MPQSFTLPALGAALLVGAGTGVHLGDSAIGLINPIHFQGPAIHPRDRGAAIDETRIAPSPPAFATHYGWAAGSQALAADCGDCDALAARDAYDSYAQGDSPAAQPAVEQHWEAPVRIHRDSHGFIVEEVAADDYATEYASERKDRLERYAHYPIEEEAKPAKPEDYAAYED